jgi:hypothetical protein
MGLRDSVSSSTNPAHTYTPTACAVSCRAHARTRAYSWLDWLQVFLPCVRWLRTYRIREYLLVGSTVLSTPNGSRRLSTASTCSAPFLPGQGSHPAHVLSSSRLPRHTAHAWWMQPCITEHCMHTCSDSCVVLHMHAPASCADDVVQWDIIAGISVGFMVVPQVCVTDAATAAGVLYTQADSQGLGARHRVQMPQPPALHALC